MSKIKFYAEKIKQTIQALRKMLASKNFLTLAYKLLHDALHILLFAFTLILIAESLLPGIITAHVGLAKLVILLLLTFMGILSLGKKLELTYPKKNSLHKSKLLPIPIIILFLLIGNSLLGLALWENILITITTLFILILFYQLLVTERK